MQSLSLQSLTFFNRHVDAFRELCSERNGLLEAIAPRDRPWAGVVKHCITAALATETLATLLGLDQSTVSNLTSYMLIHDSNKRLAKDIAFSATRSTQDNIESLFETIDPSGELRVANEPAYILQEKYVDASLEAKIVHYIDNICMSDRITSIEERIMEVSQRRSDLAADYWSREIAVSNDEARQFSEMLKSQGVECTPVEIPRMLRSRLSLFNSN